MACYKDGLDAFMIMDSFMNMVGIRIVKLVVIGNALVVGKQFVKVFLKMVNQLMNVIMPSMKSLTNVRRCLMK